MEATYVSFTIVSDIDDCLFEVIKQSKNVLFVDRLELSKQGYLMIAYWING